ncbi:MAG: cadherin-like domain-containing protein, partial [Phycisphaerae bacterium]
VADDFTIDEDETLDSTPASLLDSDDGFELTAALETPPSRGTASVNADGTFTYTPDENYNGTDSFTYTATDAQSNTDTGTVTITINPVNDAPEGVEDEYYTDVNATLVVDDVANGVLANDSDPEGDPLTASLRYDTNGTATLNADGTFTFEPDTDFLGSASFSYKVEDDKGAYDYATTVTVNVGGYAPVADQGDEGAGSFTIVDGDNDGMVIVTLDGTASYDPDGTIVGYRW